MKYICMVYLVLAYDDGIEVRPIKELRP